MSVLWNSKWCCLCFNQVTEVYLGHITCRIVNPGHGDGHLNFKTLTICKNTPSSGCVEAMELAEVQTNHTLGSRASQLNMWIRPNYSLRKLNSGQVGKAWEVYEVWFPSKALTKTKNNS